MLFANNTRAFTLLMQQPSPRASDLEPIFLEIQTHAASNKAFHCPFGDQVSYFRRVATLSLVTIIYDSCHLCRFQIQSQGFNEIAANCNATMPPTNFRL